MSKQLLLSFSSVCNSKLKLLSVGLLSWWAKAGQNLVSSQYLYTSLSCCIIMSSKNTSHTSCSYSSKFLLNMKIWNLYFSTQQILTWFVSVNSMKADWEKEKREKSVVQLRFYAPQAHATWWMLKISCCRWTRTTSNTLLHGNWMNQTNTNCSIENDLKTRTTQVDISNDISILQSWTSRG